MASTITISDYTTTYHLASSVGDPTPGGAATSASTTPYAIEHGWTLQAAPGQALFAGATLLAVTYERVTERVPILVAGSSADNLAENLRNLRRMLNVGVTARPCVLSITPNGATGAVTFDVYRADVQEERIGDGESPTFRGTTVRAVVTWVRSAFGGRAASGETLLNAADLYNRGSGTPDNVEAYSAGGGDLIYEGSPLNLQIDLQAPTWSAPGVVYLASIYSRLNSTTGSGAKTTSSTSGGTATLADWDVSAALTRPALKGRVLVLAECTSNAEFRVSIYGQVLLNLIWQSAWFQTVADGPQRKGVYDLGWIDLSAIRPDPGAGSAPAFNMRLDYRSTDGSSSTVTLDSTQFVLYYDWATIHPDDYNIWSGRRLICSQFPEQTGRPCLPWTSSVGLTLNAADDLVEPIAWRGTLPRYYSGASLLLTWSGAGLYDAAGRAVVTATHAPLYRTLRGAG